MAKTTTLHLKFYIFLILIAFAFYFSVTGVMVYTQYDMKSKISDIVKTEEVTPYNCTIVYKEFIKDCLVCIYPENNQCEGSYIECPADFNISTSGVSPLFTCYKYFICDFQGCMYLTQDKFMAQLYSNPTIKSLYDASTDNIISIYFGVFFNIAILIFIFAGFFAVIVKRMEQIKSWEITDRESI